MLEVLVREERPEDADAVYRVVKTAFQNTEIADGDEPDLVNRLRKSEAFVPELSLVAEFEEAVIGHVMFTKIAIGGKTSLTLAPLAVLPEHQRKGVGGRLVEEGHRVARTLGFGSVMVVGHPTYYPRFGYSPASRWNIRAPFEVPDDCFLALELIEGALKGVSGTAEYPREFFEREYLG